MLEQSGACSGELVLSGSSLVKSFLLSRALVKDPLANLKQFPVDYFEARPARHRAVLVGLEEVGRLSRVVEPVESPTSCPASRDDLRVSPKCARLEINVSRKRVNLCCIHV